MTSVLIANRGEIAVRVVRAARASGLRPVAVHTPGDRDALHVRLADEAHELTGADGYLDAEQLVAVARRADCGLVHPGYGFLSENAEFARLCRKAGLTFVGPSPEVLAEFGDKARARALAEAQDVPVLRATPAGTTLAEAAAFLDGLGPGAAVMVKAASGGGGRGMRVVRRPEELAEAFERCRSEAERAFGDGALYVEELLESARHIEVQVLGDGSGAVSHLWDRECTIQRRHQKLLEVAPCTTLGLEERAPLLAAACRIAAAVGYRGLGTFEFLVDSRDPGRWFFMEANPRVQVEHTVTEEITGVDLVSAQLEVALGRTLDDLCLTQADIPDPRGVAVQARVNLETLRRDGTARATSGRIEVFEVPTGPGVRVDTHGHAGLVADGRYDSLLAKVIVSVPRGGLDQAAERTDATLAEFRVEGPGTNIPALRAILNHPAFRTGEATTRFVDDHLGALLPPEEPASPEGDLTEVRADFVATVVSVPVREGRHVDAGTPLVVLESMKMEHVVTASVAGTVREVRAAVGDTVAESGLLLRLDPDSTQSEQAAVAEEWHLDAIRQDLAEIERRHAVTLDANRPEAVARRHGTGHRTARENVDDLCDAGSFVEYGSLAVAAQRRRRSLDDLIAHTPADGMVTGIGTVDGARCAVLAYDYTVLAGTQGYVNHHKTDRLLELAERQRIPVVLFAEGGGGRPGDTDSNTASGLDVPTFATMGRLSGSVPTVGIASGRCFAGNAALLGCCDVIIATEDANVGMGGPAMIEGGGLGRYRPEEVGPMSVQVPNGVVDVLVHDEAEAVDVARRYLSYFQGPAAHWTHADQRALRHVVPENRVRVYDVRAAVRGIADEDSVLELRPAFGRSVVTALVRVEGRPMGLIANDPTHLGGAIDSASADKLARFLQLCDAHGLPVVSLCDTPGFMVGPDAEHTATVRHFSRLFVVGANLRVPVVAVVLRKAYGLGAMAMVGGGFRIPAATVAWPTGEVGPMGLEGAVRLGYRRELEAIEDPAARQRAFDELVAEHYDRGKAVNAATVFELDDVIDPADTRAWIVGTLPSATGQLPPGRRSFVDTW
ncbi:carboxyl transferase domain-containing protein [Streptomyces sp. LHD-70]|uniref:acetyl-CoA carboxylase family protein n=1 Tax=Streptomyces sp. LHD-70 TaxID=3072140 RepID=UPI00280FBE8E|nr:carboxyl transferase domain-containing protein [Streptomyces sp. LHD-70]MDQ8705322.1 carboxyl transferase domain-containing protein [Streptomyces sp. LHD-70]